MGDLTFPKMGDAKLPITPYSDECPVLDELPDGETDGTLRGGRYDRIGRPGRQSADKDGVRKAKTAGDGTGVKCDSDRAG